MKKKWLLPVFAAFMIFSATPGESDTAEAATPSQLIQSGNKYLGIPYRWGGTTTSGFDCSGFTRQVFRDVGIDIGRTTWDQYARGAKVSKSNLQAGDLVFFNTAGSLTHVGIYTGNGQFINSSTSKGVSYASINDPYYWGARYQGAVRISGINPVEAAKPEVNASSFDNTVYANRGQVAYEIATALGLDTSDKIADFNDVKHTDEYAGEIEAVRKLGIFGGDRNGNFNPASPITRGQLSKVLVTAFGLQHQGGETSFTDVAADNQFNEFIQILASNEITTGKIDGSFGVGENVKHTQLDAFIERSIIK